MNNEINLDLNIIANAVITLILGVLGFLFKKLWERVDDFPEKYVPRKELDERQLRIDACIKNMEQNIFEIKTIISKSQSDLKDTLERIFDKIEQSKR